MQKIAAIFLSAILLAGAITIASPIMIDEAAASGKDKKKKDKKECYRDDSYYDKDHRYYEMCKEHYEKCEEYYQKDKKHRDYRKGGEYYEECKAYYEYTYKEYDGKDREYKKDDRKVKYDKRDKKTGEYKKYDPRDKKYDPRDKKVKYDPRDKKYGPQPYDPRDKNGKDYKYDEERQYGKDRQYQNYDPRPDYKKSGDSKKYGKYYEDPYKPKHPPMKKFVCEESGFLVNDPKDCPTKCPDGLYVMQGMTCPEIPEFPVCDNGLVVNATEFCPEKCTEGPFEGFYVMSQDQCPTSNGGNGIDPVKSNQTVCESCLMLTLNTITGAGNLEDLSAALATGFGMDANADTNNAWEVCAADNPVEAYEQTIDDEFGVGVPDPVGDSVDLFEACLIEAGLIEDEE